MVSLLFFFFSGETSPFISGGLLKEPFIASIYGRGLVKKMIKEPTDVEREIVERAPKKRFLTAVAKPENALKMALPLSG